MTKDEPVFPPILCPQPGFPTTFHIQISQMGVVLCANT